MQIIILYIIIAIAVVAAGARLYKKLSVFKEKKGKDDCSACDTCAMKGSCSKTEEGC